MQIFELLKEYNSKQRYLKDKDEAMEMFIQQKKAIDGIKKTKWFKEIQQYWQRVVLTCNERLRTIKTEDIKKVQWELNIAMDFLSFLDNIMNDDLDREDIDILNS